MPRPTKPGLLHLKNILLIDGDVLVYQVGLACERPIDWGDDLWTLHSDLGEARSIMNAKLHDLAERFDATLIKIALSCPTEEGFRRQLVPSYKVNRSNTRKPVVHAPLRQYLIENWNAVLKPRLEADDILGIWATEPRPKDENRTIVSVDKDFKGVPCEFYHLRQNGEHELKTITAAEAAHWHAMQTLMGDAVDGFKGIPGVGPVKAEKILAEAEGDYWPVIKAAYEKAGLGEAVALQNARLAYILRYGDYNDKTHKLRLWTPPKTKK